MSTNNKKFYCKFCNAGFQHQSKYDRHCNTIKHKKNSNIIPSTNTNEQIPNVIYICHTCNYQTMRHSDYKRHCETQKHNKNINLLNANVDNVVITDITTNNRNKKQSIAKPTKKKSWEMYSGRQYDIRCCCCNYEYINPNHCSYGHIISEYNIIPICYNCNGSMGKMNMHVFMLKNNYTGSALLYCAKMYMDMSTNNNYDNKFMIGMNEEYIKKLVECYQKHCSDDEFFEMIKNSTPEYKSEIRRIIQEKSTTINL